MVSTKNSSGENELVQLNTDGSIDKNFANQGKYTLDFSLEVNFIKIQSDGKILVAGTKTEKGEEYMAVIRLKKQELVKNISIESEKESAELGEEIHLTPIFDVLPVSYYWEIEDGLEKQIFKENNPSIKFKNEGVHKITLIATYADGSVLISEKFIEIKKSSSQEKEEGINWEGITITPNPTSDQFNIIGIKEGQKITVEVVDMNGRLLQKQEGRTTMNIQSLAPGVYFIKIKQEGETTVKKIIKI